MALPSGKIFAPQGLLLLRDMGSFCKKIVPVLFRWRYRLALWWYSLARYTYYLFQTNFHCDWLMLTFFNKKQQLKSFQVLYLESSKKSCLQKFSFIILKGSLVNDFIKFLCSEKVFDDSFFSIRLLNKMGRL